MSELGPYERMTSQEKREFFRNRRAESEAKMSQPEDESLSSRKQFDKWAENAGLEPDKRADGYVIWCASRYVLASRAPATTPTPPFIAGEIDAQHWACGHSKWAAKGDCITCLSHCIDSLNKRLSETMIELTKLQSAQAAAPGGKEIPARDSVVAEVTKSHLVIAWQPPVPPSHPLQDKQEPALGKVSFQLLTEKDVAEAYQAAPDWFTVLSALECRGKEPQ